MTLNEGFPLPSLEVQGSKAYTKLYLLADRKECDDYMLCLLFFVGGVVCGCSVLFC